MFTMYVLAEMAWKKGIKSLIMPCHQLSSYDILYYNVFVQKGCIYICIYLSLWNKNIFIGVEGIFDSNTGSQPKMGAEGHMTPHYILRVANK